MAAGFKVFNADGSLQFDVTNRLFRLLTVEDVGSTNSGSVNVNSQGTIGVVAVPKDASESSTPPTITVVGGQVSWNYGGAATRRPFELTIVEY